MRLKTWLGIGTVLVYAAMLPAFSDGAGPEQGVQGSSDAHSGQSDFSAMGFLEVDSQRHDLRHVYFDHRKDMLVIMVTDRPIPQDMGVYSGYMLAEAGEVSGLTVSIDKEDSKLAGYFETVFYPACGGIPMDYGDKAHIEVIRSDDEVFQARLYLDESEATGDEAFTFDVTFTVGARDVFKPMEAKVTGADSEPAIAYANYITAIMAIDVAGAKRWSCAERAAKLDTYDNIEEMLDKIRSMHPREIAILSTDVSGSSSTLEAQGERNGVLGTATVAMQLEDGKWRVQKESWNFKKE